jgi:hypothetical protein
LGRRRPETGRRPAAVGLTCQRRRQHAAGGDRAPRAGARQEVRELQG